MAEALHAVRRLGRGRSSSCQTGATSTSVPQALTEAGLHRMR